MRELATPVQIDRPYLVDTCGTGGDGAHTFNISTTAAFVVAAAGGHVAKHGNRAVSGTSGSADVLEKAGVSLGLTAAQVARCVSHLGVGFMFAPAHHGAMKYAIGPRREMGIRTLFNILGPLTNPAAAPNQVIGVFDRRWLRPLAEVLQRLGSRHVMIVHAEDGLDEISLASRTWVAELRDGAISEYTIEPEQFGFSRASLSTLHANSVDASLAMVKAVLQRKDQGAPRDIVALNAGAAIYVSGLAQHLGQGIEMAMDALCSGLAGEKLAELVSFTTFCASENQGGE
jgi:anthranilate phosphoribosyltransferase